ncbi:hypothetical protein UFOVP1479_20 [uncultured Caudovirales phage]|uniref:Uncharacterized protein n=2 Tax=uncultured Caudovirales phage TaxID=2100421 RepID=A0A6J5SL90_9CAUD|nr:hypothetical protein UFOVP947_23 [uncultured Caudovirales phage]CAB4204173.1 hypothetical protein UFOVP1386_27 [uncultured Caudovirales phage]CAB4215375.1 hypothetical protein UFOVP1479_20 [uncultured Caudovirales phage]
MIFKNWLQHNYNLLNKLSKKIDKEYGEEILHFTIEKFLEKDDLKFLDELEDDIKLKYVSRTMKIQSTSKESQFYRKIKRFTLITKDVIIEMEEENETDDLDELKIYFIKEKLKTINWFSSLLFQRYVEIGCSAQKLADQLLIPLTTCQYHIRKVKNEIKNDWNNNIKNKL